MRSLITGILAGAITASLCTQFLASDLAGELRQPPPGCTLCACKLEVYGPMSIETSVSCRPAPDFGRPMREENIWIDGRWARCWR